ncbi:MAG: S1C family serine protease [Acidimicrobiales bacterium]
MTPTPEEPPQGGSDEDDAAGRGWIDPDDRLWRHPSEVGGGPAAGATAATAAAAPTRHPRRTPIMILIGVLAALAAVAGTLILVSPGTTRTPPTISEATADTPLTTLDGGSAVPGVADAASQAMVLLRADTAHGVFDLAGVAVAEGGLVATTGADLSGLRSLAMVGPGGRLLRCSVVGADRESDIALVSVPDDLPVAPFSDDDALTDGSADLTLTVTASGGAPVLHSLPGTVTGIGGAIAAGPADGMPGITSSAVGVPEAAGDVLLDPAGAVLGIYYGGAPGAGAAAASTGGPTFLPTELVLGVADDLRSSGRVTHGWLGIEGSDAAGGAAVARVASGSPAAGHLAAGDVISALNSVPIRSMADLRGRLYVLPPSAHVALSVREGDAVAVVDLTLSASP